MVKYYTGIIKDNSIVTRLTRSAYLLRKSIPTRLSGVVDFLAPLRLVLDGVGLAVVGLLLIALAAWMQVLVEDFYVSESDRLAALEAGLQPQTEIVQPLSSRPFLQTAQRRARRLMDASLAEIERRGERLPSPGQEADNVPLP